jgi:hypothetical protein
MAFPLRERQMRVDVEIDGQPAGRVVGAGDPRGRQYDWYEVPVRRELLDGKQWVTVTARVPDLGREGKGWVGVAGGNFEVEGLRSAFFNGYGYLTEDMSNTRGAQAGTLLIFLNEAWPARIERVLPESGLSLDYSIVERLVWARVALANYAAHPLFGSGFGSLVFRAPPYIGTGPVFVEFVNAHNNYVQVLSELGLLGLAGWLVAVLAPVSLVAARCWVRRRGRRAAPFHLAFGGFFAAWALVSLAQYTLTDTRLFHLWLFYLGLWAAQFHRGGYGLLPWPRAERPRPDRRALAAGGVEVRERAW